MTSTVLDAIVGSSRRSAAERAKRVTRGALEREAAAVAPRPNALAMALSAPGVRIIAECKRRSPSRGVLCRDYQPARIAAGYAAAGAAAISVLTEPAFFDGSLDHLREVTRAVQVPVLRKDFVVSEYQVIEARAAGAAAVLFIVAALSDRDLSMLIGAAATFQVDALVEVHSAAEVDRALTAGARIIGVNSRDLRTLEMSPEIFETVAPLIPDDVTMVAESGISTPADLARLQRAGYDAYLIGERFMTTDDPGSALGAFMRDARAAVAP
jgi:indole-3-glycerol phosphate synthase